MEDPGRELRRVREQLGLKYRDVEESSQQIARAKGSHEFLIGLSRLSDIENKGTLPSMYRLYSLCVIYGLNFHGALKWFGINLHELATDAAKLSVRETRPADFACPPLTFEGMPIQVDPDLRSSETVFLNPHIRQWGRLALSATASLDLHQHRYAFVGTDDWFMYPVLPPGSFIQIDEASKRLSGDEAVLEYERPIHFIEHRGGFKCGWCSESNGFLVVQPHPTSSMRVELYKYPGEVDIIGRVIGVAKRLDLGRRPRTRS